MGSRVIADDVLHQNGHAVSRLSSRLKNTNGVESTAQIPRRPGTCQVAKGLRLELTRIQLWHEAKLSHLPFEIGKLRKTLSASPRFSLFIIRTLENRYVAYIGPAFCNTLPGITIDPKLT